MPSKRSISSVKRSQIRSSLSKPAVPDLLEVADEAETAEDVLAASYAQPEVRHILDIWMDLSVVSKVNDPGDFFDELTVLCQ